MIRDCRCLDGRASSDHGRPTHEMSIVAAGAIPRPRDSLFSDSTKGSVRMRLIT
jgi:hypothetical protein